MITCVLLAAGHSQRFGSVKALVNIHGQPLIQRLQENILASNIDELIVVLGAHAHAIEPFLLKHNKVNVVHNKDYNFGQTSSFQAGLNCVKTQMDGMMMLPVDYPFVTPETLNLLYDQFHCEPHKILIPAYQNKKGHPPVFPAALKKEFEMLDFIQGLNTVQHNHDKDKIIYKVNDPGVIQTFNTPEELAVILDDHS